jgi:hypothetical protein
MIVRIKDRTDLINIIDISRFFYDSNEVGYWGIPTPRKVEGERFLHVARHIPDVMEYLALFKFSFKKLFTKQYWSKDYITINYMKYDKFTMYIVYCETKVALDFFKSEEPFVTYLEFPSEDDAMLFFLEHDIKLW